MSLKLKAKFLLPDILTSINILLALSSVILVMQSFTTQTAIPKPFVFAGWMIIIASLIDGLDGKCARWVGKTNNFGVHFDSFADLMVFGFAPSILVYAVFF